MSDIWMSAILPGNGPMKRHSYVMTASPINHAAFAPGEGFARGSSFAMPGFGGLGISAHLEP
ncbi:hypothetical protein [Bradyrhizobium sp.]|uniref:hypothetical protein n=1 Tax=Bradyrhizobium sp. TaxID=376 RepID=UPI0039E56B5C